MALMRTDRSRMTARVVPLQSEEAGDMRMGGTPFARVAAVAELTLEAWRLAGRALRRYRRGTIPVGVTSLHDHPAAT
jgi:hypothetical protein